MRLTRASAECMPEAELRSQLAEGGGGSCGVSVPDRTERDNGYPVLRSTPRRGLLVGGTVSPLNSWHLSRDWVKF